MNKKIYIPLIIALALILGAVVFFSSLPKSYSSGFESDYVTALNQARAHVHLQPLKRNTVLEQAAKAQVKDMIAKDYLKEISPSGVSYQTLVQQTGFPMSSYLGEDIGRKYKTGQDFLSDMETLNSPYIGSMDATEIGVYAEHISTGYVVVAEYGI